MYILKEYGRDVIEFSLKEISILHKLNNVTFNGHKITPFLFGIYYKEGPCFVLEYIPFSIKIISYLKTFTFVVSKVIFFSF